MHTMSLCLQCGAKYDPSAASGMCPKCLLGAARNHASPESFRPTEADRAKDVPPKPREIESLFPELEILDLIGHGGMGYVYRARQKNLGREVAVKLLSTALMNDPAFAERFSREARAMAMMNHPNIISIYDFGHRGSYYYLVMEYVDGLNLRQLVQSTRLQPAESMQIVPQLCDALQYAHDRGIVHRDIKPENVLLSQDGQIKIADFGLAKLTGSSQHNVTLTQTQQVMGTLNYMAPEQRERPTEVDHRADIYSLGVVIYELLTGELPLGKFAPPSQKVEVDVRIDEVVLRALEKEPALRFQQASEIKTGVQAIGAGQPVFSHMELNGALLSGPMAYKIRQFVVMMIALVFCITGFLCIVLSGQGFGGISKQSFLAVGFTLAAIGGFLFAANGIYASIFHPNPSEEKQSEPG